MDRLIEDLSTEQLRRLKAVLDAHEKDAPVDDGQQSGGAQVISEVNIEQGGSKRKVDDVEKESIEAGPIRPAPALREPLAPRQDLAAENVDASQPFDRDAKAKAAVSIHTQLTIPTLLHKSGVKPPAKRTGSIKGLGAPAEQPGTLSQKILATRFIQRLSPDENIFHAARRSCMLFYESAKTTQDYARVLKILNDPNVRISEGKDRCGHCKTFSSEHSPPPGTEQWPCISVGDGTRCTFCTITHITCSFNRPIKPVSSAKANKVIAIDEPGQPAVISKSAGRDLANSQVVPAFSSSVPSVPGHGPGPSNVAGPSNPNGSSRGRVGRQKRSFIGQMKNLMSVASEWCKEVESTGESEEVPELMADTLKEMRRQMRSLEEIAEGVAGE